MNLKAQSLGLLAAAIFFFVLTIAFHLIASYFYLYWTLAWIDTLIHFLGGVDAALLFLWIIHSTNGDISAKSTFIWVLIVGVFWEIYEFKNGLTIYSISFIFDTLSDLCMDLSGGLLAYLSINWLTRAEIKRKKESTI